MDECEMKASLFQVRYSKLPFRMLVRLYDVDVAFSPMIMSDSFSSSQKARDKIARLFGETEANLLLDNANVVNNIFETMKVIIYIEHLLSF